ncbi:MAG: LCP family protein [Coriobacteriia bacterium]|nr:LCP family protein [Coriobacteriia bacterium]MBN2839528.1 LCP family protein [Coriobacteriia bacterium]
MSSVMDRMNRAVEVDPAIQTALEQPEDTAPRDPFYMVIMGVDTREGDEVSRSDTLIVARIDPKEKTTVLISIPRDTRVDIPGEYTTKINAAHSLGGPALVIETVSEFTGLPISHYMEIDFNGFKEMVDALGGVEINVPQKIVDPKAGNYDPNAYTIHAGPQTLNGAQALTFVRSRNFPLGDLTRIENQQIFIKALVKQSLAMGNTLKLPALVNALADSVSTDMSASELLKLATAMKGMEEDGLETISMPGTPETIGGVSYIIVDDDAFADIIDRVSQGLSPEPGAEVGVTMPSPSSITVTVRNGAGIEGVASDAAGRLSAAGFVVGEVGNANQFVYDETLIVYNDDEAAAQVVQGSLGAGRPVASRGMYSFQSDILLVVGKDWEIQ